MGEPVEWGEDDDCPGGGFAEGLKSGEILCKYDINLFTRYRFVLPYPPGGGGG